MREADWTPSPHIERETASLRRRMRWEGELNVWIAGASGMVAVMSVPFLVDAMAKRSSWVEIGLLALVVLASIALTGYVAVRDAALKRTATASDDLRREELGRGVGWLVDLMILQGAAPTGTDRGMLWFEGGRLCFSGDRTSFALSADQVAGRCETVVPIPGLRYATRVPLTHSTSAGRLGLSLSPIDVGPARERDVVTRAAARVGSAWTGDPDCDQFRRAIDRWASIASTDGQLPPLRLGPGAPSLFRLFLTAAFGTAYWTVAVTLIWSSIDFTSINAGGVVLGLLLVLGGLLRRLPLVLRWRALRDRWRLEHR